jgi:anti-anti-sigma factor
MEITTHSSSELVELQVAGLLDNNWSEQLARAIDDTIRLGTHRLLINLNEVTYLSSAGIGVLVHAHRQLQAIQGFFGISELSPQCRQVLKLTGLLNMLVCDAAKVREISGSDLRTTQPEFFLTSQNGVNFEIYDIAPQATLRCRPFGRPDLLPIARFSEDQSHSVQFPANGIGLGLGAFGDDFASCQTRCGEFLAVAGAVAQQPAMEGYAPDYQVAKESFLPRVQSLYGLVAEGNFSKLLRFEPSAERQPIGLSSLAEQALSASGANLAGMVFVAETTGLVGAALKRSPAEPRTEPTNLFAHPEIRKWLSFTPEQMYPRTLVLIAGIAARTPLTGIAAELAPWLRPLHGSKPVHGHFHAAVFSYRPVKKGRLDLAQTVNLLFENEHLHAVLHLLGDDRKITGAGESEFLTGVGWVGPIVEVVRSGN